ncbi:MAG: FAD:protein FMN transferase [Candidatus Nanoarchaeia archaeon]
MAYQQSTSLEKHSEFTSRLCGGEIVCVLYDLELAKAQDIWNKTYQEALRLEKIFNFYDTDSELNLLNSTRKLQVSSELREVLECALHYAQFSHGLLDVSKGKQFLARKQGKELQVSCSYQDISIQEDFVELTHPDVLLDLGSIAKGFIGDKLIQFLKTQGIPGAFIDLRGDMIIYGDHLEVVDIVHPRGGEALATIILENAAVATSGDYKQFTTSYDHSHLVGKQRASVTIIAPTLMEADALATCTVLTEDLTPTQPCCVWDGQTRMNAEFRRWCYGG